jgi:hypothetical protein
MGFQAMEGLVLFFQTFCDLNNLSSFSFLLIRFCATGVQKSIVKKTLLCTAIAMKMLQNEQEMSQYSIVGVCSLMGDSTCTTKGKKKTQSPLHFR